MGTGTLNLNILKTENQGDAIIELTDSGANGGVIFSGVTTFNDSATFNSIVNFSGSSSLSLQDSSIPVSKLQVPGGTPSSSTFLRGDNQWAEVDVLSATAGATVGAVGTYALLRIRSTNLSAGGTVAASSNMRYANASGGEGGLVNSGTWRCMGTIYTGGTANDQVTLFLRIV